MIFQKHLREILEEYRNRLVDILGEDLDDIFLYGSQARGDAVEGSDIDVLCIMKKPFDYGHLLQMTSEATAEISLHYDVVLSRAFITRKDYLSQRTPFIQNIHREHIPI